MLINLYLTFLKIGMMAFGGGYAVIPLIDEFVVQGNKWMNSKEFLDLISISQMTPGPIGINAATFAGVKTAGFFGGVAATAGFIAPSLIIGITLARVFLKYGDIGPVRGILNGLRPAVVALICAASISFVLLAVWNTEETPVVWGDYSAGGVIILVSAVVAVRRKVGVITVLVGAGVLGLVLGMAGLLAV